MQHALKLVLALLVLLAAAPCLAQPESTRIVLVARPGMDELANRFVAELRSLSFDVVRAPDAETVPSSAELEALAIGENARAAVRVDALETSVDLWLVNPSTHEVVYRRVVSDRDPAVAVLRALEILRGALVDLQALEAEPPPEPPPSPAPAPPPSPPPELSPPPSPPRWSLRLAGGLLFPHASSNLSGVALAAGHHRFAAHFTVDLEAFASLTAFSVAGSGGHADVRLAGALLGASVLPAGAGGSDGWLEPSLGLGVGALGIWTTARPDEGFSGSNNLRFTAFPHSRARVGLRLTGGSRLSLGLVAGFGAPRPVLLFAEQRDSNWLNPLIIASLGWEARFR